MRFLQDVSTVGKDAVDVDVITDPQRVIAMQQACEDVFVDDESNVHGRNRC